MCRGRGFATTAILPAAAGRLAADKGSEAGVKTAVYAIEQLRSWDLPVWMVVAGVVLQRRQSARLAT
jgi:hypothetical protein